MQETSQQDSSVERSAAETADPRPAHPRTSPPRGAAGAGDARQLLYLLLLVPGLFLTVAASRAYPLLDARIPAALILCGIVIPVGFQMWAIVRRRAVVHGRRMRAVYLATGSALLLLGLLLFVNGRLDRSPRNAVEATVLHKLAIDGKHGKQYHLGVSSWRRGRKLEDLRVNSGVYARARIGKPVTVEVHPGFLGIPWSAGVSD